MLHARIERFDVMATVALFGIFGLEINTGFLPRQIIMLSGTALTKGVGRARAKGNKEKADDTIPLTGALNGSYLVTGLNN